MRILIIYDEGILSLRDQISSFESVDLLLSLTDTQVVEVPKFPFSDFPLRLNLLRDFPYIHINLKSPDRITNQPPKEIRHTKCNNSLSKTKNFYRKIGRR